MEVVGDPNSHREPDVRQRTLISLPDPLLTAGSALPTGCSRDGCLCAGGLERGGLMLSSYVHNPEHRWSIRP
jgi:hypothetical protein